MKKEKETEREKQGLKRVGQEEKAEIKIEPRMKMEEKSEKEKWQAERAKAARERGFEIWVPKTELGRLVKAGKIKDIDEIFSRNMRILEPEIVDFLMPDIESELILIGQAKGKFGGGKRRPWRQTQKKTAEGNVHHFGCMAVAGDKAGHVGLGYGKAKETVPAKEKAIRDAKIELMPVARGCGSPECTCSEPHSIPFRVEGKSGSARIRLMPAPKGTGLVVDKECKKIIVLAGIKDIYSKTFGQTRTKFNLAKATIDALQKLNKFIK